MANVKRARTVDSEVGGEQPPDISACAVKDDSVIELPANIGRLSAMCTWPARANEQVLADRGNSASAKGDIAGSALDFAVGTETGSIALIHRDGSVRALEKNGGPSILCLLIKETELPAASDTDKRNAYAADIVSGDSDGRVTMFAAGQVFSRNMLSAPISAIARDSNPHAASSFIVGDMSGVVTACHAQEVLWRSQIKPHLLSPQKLCDPGIRAVCSVRFPDKHGILTSYVLAAAGGNHIQVLSHGTPVTSIQLSASCSSMCVGSFVQTHTQRGSPVDKRQVLLGDEAGGLQVLDGFELIPYAQLDYPIADIVSVPRKALTGHSGPDVVVCATCSNHIYVLCNRHIIGTYSAGFWPASLGLYFQPNGRKPRIAVAETRAGAVADTARNLVHILALDIAS